MSIALRWVSLLVLLASPLHAQEIPAPNDHAGAFRRTLALYNDATASVLAAINALTRDDTSAFENAVRDYRRLMPFLLVWQGRACWTADHRGANVAYPVQATMGEALTGWSSANTTMTEAGIELLRGVLISSLTQHAEMLNNTLAEVMRECGTSVPEAPASARPFTPAETARCARANIRSDQMNFSFRCRRYLLRPPPIQLHSPKLTLNSGASSRRGVVRHPRAAIFPVDLAPPSARSPLPRTRTPEPADLDFAPPGSPPPSTPVNSGTYLRPLPGIVTPPR